MLQIYIFPDESTEHSKGAENVFCVPVPTALPFTPTWPAIVVTPVGNLVVTEIGDDAAEPTAFTAVTVTVYVVPLDNPVNKAVFEATPLSVVGVAPEYV